MPAALAAFEFPPVSHLFEWPVVILDGTPLAINKTVVLTGAAALLTIGFFVLGSRKRALVPSGFQNLAESSYELVEENIAVEVMGAEDGKRWTPFLTSLFFFIFFMNIFEVIPGIQFPPTSRIAIPALLAIIVWLMMIFLGMKTQGVGGYFKSSLFPPGVPKVLYLLVTPIEFISTFLVRPFSHAVRLFANMMAGHILLTTFALLSAALWLGKWNAIFLPLPVVGGAAMTGFEVLVAVLQAYIFTILTAVYIGGSLHPEH
ncbi:MAG: F0F1 ATP synthase subunit A [Acidimicrobiia bacterium]|nr:F0F1 ATP synthase subunit A [Acidimicrobiia bacterium]